MLDASALLVCAAFGVACLLVGVAERNGFYLAGALAYAVVARLVGHLPEGKGR